MATLSSLLDSLYCQEQHWEPEPDDLTPLLGYQELESQLIITVAAEEEKEEVEWAELLSSLTSKELDIYPDHPRGSPEVGDDGSNPYLLSARQGIVKWVLRACTCHGFSALTVVLAVSYLDRCFLGGGGGGGLRLQEDRPWMGRLSAVACLSLAAKVEETHVPLLLDLQAAVVAENEESAGYLFEAKTVRRMELLVLSALGWRMNPVTPLSFIHHLLPKLRKHSPTAAAGGAHQLELLRRCHAILISVIADWRWVRYPPSVWALATLLQAMGQSLDPSEYCETHHLLSLLDLSKERVEGCYQLISGSICGDFGVGLGVGTKRKPPYSCYHEDYYTSPPSPNGVIGSCFSCEGSSSGGESWAMWPASVSSSPDPPPSKRPNCGIARDDDEDAGGA